MGFAGTGKIWMNGSLVDWADAKLHIGSHVIHYGSGVFEGARCYETAKGSACFRLDAHIRRLYDSAKIYRMEYPLPRQDFEDAVLETIRANEFRACYIRPLIYRGYAALGVNPFPCPVDAAIMLWEWGRYLGAEALEKGVDVCVSSWARSAPNTFPSLAKSCANYANSQLIKMEAISNGYCEGIGLDAAGQISEAAARTSFSCATASSTHRRWARRSSRASRATRSSRWRTIWATRCARNRCRARCCTSPTRYSSRARPSRSRRSGPSTRSRSAADRAAR